jgi:hypothetical protein
MIKARADELIAALRSGKYQQTKSQLRHGNAFCCLGVACEISKLGEWIGQRYSTHDNISTFILPKSVQDYFGFSNRTGLLLSDSLIDDDPALSTMNDHGHSFTEIADFIEANWERL